MAADSALEEPPTTPAGNFKTTFEIACYQLTDRDFPLYSCPMDTELKALEEKVALLVELTHRLRLENRDLRQQLAQATNDNKRLGEKVDAAKAKLEGLLAHLPEEQS